MPDVVAGIEALTPAHGPLLVVVGVFDGLHRGHLYLLRELRRAALRRGARPAVLTFDHHPDEILAGAAPPLLCDPDERIARLERAGIAVTVIQHFDEALRRTSYRDFVGAIRARTALSGFLMTPDAAFGHERAGTPAALAALGAIGGFAVVTVPPFDLAGRQVRSTEVRAAIAQGKLEEARALLGRRVAVSGDLDAEGILRFALPVALPPDGDYAVALAKPMRAGDPPPDDARRATARVDRAAGIVGLAAARGGLSAGPVRLSFLHPVSDRRAP